MWRLQTPQLRGRQEGMALIISLVLLTILTIGVMATARSISVSTRLATNVQTQNIAIQTADGTAKNAQGLIAQGAIAPTGYSGNANGQYVFNPQNPPVWAPSPWLATPLNWSSATQAKQSSFGTLPAKIGAFVVEQLPPVIQKGENAGSSVYGTSRGQTSVYRVTARAVGPDGNRVATIQTIVRN